MPKISIGVDALVGVIDKALENYREEKKSIEPHSEDSDVGLAHLEGGIWALECLKDFILAETTIHKS